MVAGVVGGQPPEQLGIGLQTGHQRRQPPRPASERRGPPRVVRRFPTTAGSDRCGGEDVLSSRVPSVDSSLADAYIGLIRAVVLGIPYSVPRFAGTPDAPSPGPLKREPRLRSLGQITIAELQ